MKKTDKIFIYDHSFHGFLSAVFKAFEQKTYLSDIQSSRNIQTGLFTETVNIKTNIGHAKRVWYSIQKKNYNALKTIYFAFLSESHGTEFLLYNYIRKLALKHNDSDSYCSDEDILKIHQLASLVSSEKQRMQSQINLHSTQSKLRFGYLEPAFNVLPLLSRHLKSKYKDEPWIVFDRKRKYGLYFDLEKIQIISHNFLKLHIEKLNSNSALANEGTIADTPGKLDDHKSAGKVLLEERTYSAA